jgi:NADP-reducing hydrogenase subunit HndB
MIGTTGAVSDIACRPMFRSSAESINFAGGEATMPKLRKEDLDIIARDVRIGRMLNALGYRARITVHMDTCGIAAGAKVVYETLVSEVEKRGLLDVHVAIGTCIGLCAREPMVTVEVKGQPSITYGNLTPSTARVIFSEHVMGGRVVEEHAFSQGASERDEVFSAPRVRDDYSLSGS